MAYRSGSLSENFGKGRVEISTRRRQFRRDCDKFDTMATILRRHDVDAMINRVGVVSSPSSKPKWLQISPYLQFLYVSYEWGIGLPLLIDQGPYQRIFVRAVSKFRHDGDNFDAIATILTRWRQFYGDMMSTP